MRRLYITPSLEEVSNDTDIVLVSMTADPPTVEGGKDEEGNPIELPSWGKSPSRRAVFNGMNTGGASDGPFGSSPFGDSPF